MHLTAIAAAIALVTTSIPAPDTDQSLRDAARLLAKTEPNGQILQPVPPFDYERMTIGQLAREASVAIIGTVTRVRTHLGPADDRVITDYRIVASEVIAGELPGPYRSTPGQVAEITLSLLGGELMVEGVTIRSPDNSLDAIRDGRTYLVFLKDSPEPSISRFNVFNGGIFELDGEKIRPLLKLAEHVFEDIRGIGLTRMRALIAEGRSK